MIHKTITFLMLYFLASHLLLAQETPSSYTDFKPQYRKWQPVYIIDKIEYTKDRTIFYFRFVCDQDSNSNAKFYPKKHPKAWYLQDKNSNQKFSLVEIRNVYRDNSLMLDKVKKEFTLYKTHTSNTTIFSCEVHFERLPATITKVDLIEGASEINNGRHFHCFDIEIKPATSPDLGTAADVNLAKDADPRPLSEQRSMPKDARPKPNIRRKEGF